MNVINQPSEKYALKCILKALQITGIELSNLREQNNTSRMPEQYKFWTAF